MTRTTQDIYDLVRDAIKIVPQTFSEDVIEDAFLAVGADQGLLNRLSCCRSAHGRNVTNQMFGRYVRDAVNGVAIRQVAATRTHLTGSYSKVTIGK